MTPPRHQTSTDRDLSGLEARKRREAEHLAVPHEVKDPVTGVIPRGPALDAARAERGTAEQIKHLEHRADLLVDELIASRAFVRIFLLKVLGIIGLVVTAYLAGKHLG